MSKRLHEKANKARLEMIGSFASLYNAKRMSQTLESRFKAGRKAIDDRMTENGKSHSSVFHKVMQEKMIIVMLMREKIRI